MLSFKKPRFFWLKNVCSDVSSSLEKDNHDGKHKKLKSILLNT